MGPSSPDITTGPPPVPSEPPAETPEPPKDAETPPDETPAPSEPSASKEISPARRREEITRLAALSIQTMAKTIEAASMPTNENQGAMLGVASLARGEVPSEKTSWDENPIFITREKDGTSTKYKLVGITGVSEGNFACKLKPVDSVFTAIEDENIPVQEIYDLDLLSEGDRILAEASGDDAEIIRLRLAILRDPELQIKPETDELIKRKAKESGILTVEDLISLQQAIEGKLSDKSTPEEKDLSERLKKIGAEENLLDFSTVVSVFSEIGFSPSQVDLRISALEKGLTEAQQRLTANPKNERLLADYENAKASLLLMQQAAQALKADGALKQYFDLVNQGRVDLDTAKKFAENFRSGNLDDIISKLPGMENLTLDKKWELLKKNKAKEGLLILLILALMGTVSATDFIKIPQR